MNINEELKKFVEEKGLNFTLGDLARYFFGLGKTETVDKACQWVANYDPGDYLEEVADFGEYMLDEKSVIEDFIKFVSK